MFIAGLILLAVGATMVYGTKYITFLVYFKQTQPLVIKTIGLIIALVGVSFIFFGDFPSKLGEIRILKFIERMLN